MSRLAIFLFFILTICQIMDGVELRAVVENTSIVKEKLQEMGAVFLADYQFTDHIYTKKTGSQDLDKEFIRIRDYQITHWDQKKVVVLHKLRDQIAGNHKKVFEQQCDTLEEGVSYIPGDYHKVLVFSRQGWQYSLNGMSIFLEEIAGMPSSVEIICANRDIILDFFKTIQSKEVLNSSAAQWVKDMVD